ncbi:hypothetical protein OC835_004975 [Tilletia horrida]|nr:hypothetical protein OC835_004975 [Tilletia horrida]
MFEPRPSPSFTSTSGKWIPRLDSSPLQIKEYVTHYFGEGDVLAQDVLDQTEAFDRYSGNFAPSIKVDARLSGAANISREAIYGPLCYPLWMAITTLVCRVGMPNPNLKYLHLRFSANDALLGRVEHIVASNPRLLDVVIEIDYPQAAHHVQDRPVLRLAKIADRYTQYAPLDRFVVRAPGVDVDAEDATSFASRIRRCSTLVFAVRSVRYVTAVRQWSMHLLRDLTCAQQVEISVANDQPPRPQAPRSFVKMHLPSLVHLTLDFSGIGAGFLHNVDAKGILVVKVAAPPDTFHLCLLRLFIAQVWSTNGSGHLA